MNEETYLLIKGAAGVIATLGLYSVLYRENKFYRFWEHVFLGLAGGWALVALWTDTLKASWWDQMVGTTGDPASNSPGTPGHWVWAVIIPIGVIGFLVNSKKYAWLSRIPIGIILGLWSGQQLQVWWTRFGPQIEASLLPVFPTSDQFTVPNMKGLSPEAINAIKANVYPSQAISNLIALITILSVLSYFIFSVDFKNRWMLGMTKLGRYLLMIGFGAIFGSTVMMRFTLLIDRMHFIWIEWLQQQVLHR